MAGKEDSTGGASPTKGEALRAVAEVGGVRSSVDPVPDLWSGQPAEERRDAACSAGEKRRVRELTLRRTTWRVVREVNQVTRGWSNYFALGHGQRSFGQMNHFIAHRLRQWLWRKHGNAAGKYKRWPNSAPVATHGLYQLPTYLT